MNQTINLNIQINLNFILWSIYGIDLGIDDELYDFWRDVLLIFLQSHKNSSKESKSRKKSRHHQSQQVQHAEVQLLICHDVVAQILYVTVLRARNLLTLREDGDTRPDPFIKVYLLPGRR